MLDGTDGHHTVNTASLTQDYTSKENPFSEQNYHIQLLFLVAFWSRVAFDGFFLSDSANL